MIRQAASNARIGRIEARGLTKFHGRHTALHNCSFSLEAGESLVVLGPNGAGKTTLLSLLATLASPSEGEIFVNTAALTNDNRDFLRRNLGFVGHEGLLYYELTGRENLKFFAQLRECKADSVDFWLHKVRLENAADRPVSTYSRGMKQRLSIARALIHSPSLVLFDEPLTGLDRESQEFFYSVIDELRNHGCLTVSVTHHLDWPTHLVDRAIVLASGHVRRAVAGHDLELSSIYREALR